MALTVQAPLVASWGSLLRPVAEPAFGQRFQGSSGPRAQSSPGTRCVLPLLGVAPLLAARGSRKGTRGRAVQRRSAAASAPAVPEEAAFDVTQQAGVCGPYGSPGEYVWDPLELSKNIDETGFRWYRQAELKHGRVAMLALAGILNQHYWRFGGLELKTFEEGLGFQTTDLEGVPNGFGAVTGGAGPYMGLLVLLVGIIELRTSDEGREPGDFGDPAGFVGTDVNGFKIRYNDEWRNFELNHGRLAMFGIIGALSAEYVTGMDSFGQWAQFAPLLGKIFGQKNLFL